MRSRIRTRSAEAAKMARCYFSTEARSRDGHVAVARRDGDDGFLVTAYPTDAIKIEETVWTRSR
jgi:hypothetical protein